MRPLVLFLLLLGLSSADGAWASSHVVDITWSAKGAFKHSAAIPQGKFVEVCGKLEPGSTVRWSFEASGPMDFNIHYHVAEKVIFATKRTQVVSSAESLAVVSSEAYCWMWTNQGTAPARVSVELTR